MRRAVAVARDTLSSLRADRDRLESELAEAEAQVEVPGDPR